MVQPHLRAVETAGLAVGRRLGQRVGAEVDQTALQAAVDRRVEGVELDRGRQVQLELADVNRVELELDHQFAVGGRDLHQLVARAQHPADGAELEQLDHTGHRCGDAGVVQNAFALGQLVAAARQVLGQLGRLLPSFLQVFVAHCAGAALQISELTARAHHLEPAGVAGLQQRLVHRQFLLRHVLAVLQRGQLLAQAAPALLEQGLLRRHELRKLLEARAEHRRGPARLGLRAQQRGSQRGVLGAALVEGRVGTRTLQRGKLLAGNDGLALLHQDVRQHTAVRGLDHLGSAARNQLTLGAHALVDLEPGGPGHEACQSDGHEQRHRHPRRAWRRGVQDFCVHAACSMAGALS